MRAGAKGVSPEWWETLALGLGRAQWKADRIEDCCRPQPGRDIKRNTSALHNGLCHSTGMGRRAGKNLGEFLNCFHRFFRKGSWSRSSPEVTPPLTALQCCDFPAIFYRQFLLFHKQETPQGCRDRNQESHNPPVAAMRAQSGQVLQVVLHCISLAGYPELLTASRHTSCPTPASVSVRHLGGTPEGSPCSRCLRSAWFEKALVGATSSVTKSRRI